MQKNYCILQSERDGRKVAISYPDILTVDEALELIRDIPLLLEGRFPLVGVEIICAEADDTFTVQPHYNTITRIRRITGYMSQVENFNDAKKAELAARVQHVK